MLIVDYMREYKSFLFDRGGADDKISRIDEIGHLETLLHSQIVMARDSDMWVFDYVQEGPDDIYQEVLEEFKQLDESISADRRWEKVAENLYRQENLLDVDVPYGRGGLQMVKQAGKWVYIPEKDEPDYDIGMDKVVREIFDVLETNFDE